MTVNGFISAIFPIENGTSQSGNEWKRQTAIVTYDSNERFPKSILFSVTGDNIEKFDLKQGVAYSLEIDFTTREHEGKYYMTATCWKATPKV